ncbi:MAG: pentapeptide repeat-containing protein [Nodosilinea sp.]
MDNITLLKRYSEGKRDFSWADLRQADLTHAELSGINLYRANLAGANLTGASLAEANLFRADLSGANLSGANLADANLRRANLSEAQIELEQIRDADVRGACLPQALIDDLDPEPAAVSLMANEVAPSPAVASVQTPKLADSPPVTSPGNQQELWISLAFLGIGHVFYGVILGSQQVWLGFWLLTLLPVMLGLQEELVWFMPMLGAIAVVASLGLSAGVLIFFLPVVLGVGVALAICGSILGWGWGQTLKNTAWFSGLAFLAMHSAIWLFDGSNAYGGGGIVLKLDTSHLVLLLGLGLLALWRGMTAYELLIDLRISKSRQLLYVGGSAAAGLLIGMLVSS